jgi:hypothetical protein
MRVNALLTLLSKNTGVVFFYDFDNLGNGFFSPPAVKLNMHIVVFDAEIGLPLLSYCDFSLYGAAGPYYYTLSHQENFWGGHGRLELNWKSILSLQIQISYDNVLLNKCSRSHPDFFSARPLLERLGMSLFDKPPSSA